MDRDPDTAEKLVMALGAALVRKGALDLDDLIAAAERQEDPAIAHLLGVMAVEAQAPTALEREAERRRAQIRLVDK